MKMKSAEEYAVLAEEAVDKAYTHEVGTYLRRDELQLAQVYAQLAIAAATREAHSLASYK